MNPRYKPCIIVPKSEDVLEDMPREGRMFRQVIEAVQNGMEQLGEACSKSEYDFKKPEDVDMDCPVQTFVSKLDVGAEIANTGSFADRLADRLGLTKETPSETPSE